MLRQMRESMLIRQMLHVCIACNTQNIQSSDWLNDVARYDVTLYSAICWRKRHFRSSKKLVDDTSIRSMFLYYGMCVFKNLDL